MSMPSASGMLGIQAVSYVILTACKVMILARQVLVHIFCMEIVFPLS